MVKGQVWMGDFLVGIVVFIVIIAVYFIAAGNISSFTKSGVDVLYAEAIGVSELLLSQPGENTSIAIMYGNHRINTTRIQELSTLEYSELRSFASVKHDFAVFFEEGDENIELGGISSLGYPNVNKTALQGEASALVAVKRYAIANEKIITLVVYTWR